MHLAAFHLPLLGGSAGAQAQHFVELGSRVDDPGIAGDGADTFAADIDIDMLRSAPQRLALPASDGRVLLAELSVFENRGDGDFMWAGGFAEAGFESVVLTMRDGHLSGLFDEPGGALLRIAAGPDGQGRLEDTSGMRLPADRVHCPGGRLPEEGLAVPAEEAASEGRTHSAGEATDDNTLDVLVVYTQNAKAYWTSRMRTPGSASQSAIDYMNMVFRNGHLDRSARLAHVEEAPYSVTGIEGDGTCDSPLDRLEASPRLARLRAEHRADTLHLFAAAADASAGDCVGLANQLHQGHTPGNFVPVGITLVDLLVPEQTFVHETGHNLGLHHDPADVQRSHNEDRAAFEDYRLTQLLRPYALGHNFEAAGVKSIMAIGAGRTTPWFSTVREEPMGWKLGVKGESENERALREVSLALVSGFGDSLAGRDPEPPEPPPGWRPLTPVELRATRTGSTRVRLTWVDYAVHEDGFRVERRQAGRRRWQVVKRLPKDIQAVEIDGLAAGSRYDFRVFAYNENGDSDPGNVVTVSLRGLEYASCVPSGSQIRFAHGYEVSMCFEHLEDGIGPLRAADASDYGLDSRESGLLYFFDRDNAEVLVKVLDACAINGYRWVFVAPVTDLPFNLYIDETATGSRWTHRNPKGGQTALTKSDVTAFRCGATASLSGSVVGRKGVHGIDLVESGFLPVPAGPVLQTATVAKAPPVHAALEASGIGQRTDCVPEPALALTGGYLVGVCYETRDGKVDDARDWGLDSRQSGLLYFFSRDNAEVLIKVLDGCRVNGHRWVFVAPVTDLAFNLQVKSPEGDVWTHSGFQRLTASAKSDIQAFAC